MQKICAIIKIFTLRQKIPKTPPPPCSAPSCHASVGGGVPDAPPLTAAPPLIPCRAAPMCAAADHHRTFKTCHCEPVRTLVWQSVIPLRRTPVLWRNGFPRRFAPRNDIFIKNHPVMRRGGVLPRPSRRTPCYSPVGRGDPVAVPKISTLPYGGRLKF